MSILALSLTNLTSSTHRSTTTSVSAAARATSVPSQWLSQTPSTSTPPPSTSSDRTLLTSNRSTVIRSNITLLGTVFAAAFGMQLAFDTGSDRVWDSMNRGRQWKDIKQRYIEAAEDDE
ncbi:hypothetical protein E8E13_000845 [Curvularia kusanoi]|uniref:Complex III subunit 9 n=1 Tax=Curvularia kusanoi TaxID=90978 RepID=A0A9P4TPE1_CURKU|nr:hypothetical protein E8E13_000845 [Curvularia kusanoi]